MFSGSIVAIVTPFANDAVDYEALGKLVDWHIEQGTDAIVPCGTTGESATFSHEEQHDVIGFVVERVAGRIPVIAGTGSNNTREAVSLAENAARRGANGILSVTPYYNKPTQEGLYQHYKAVREAVDLPLVLYNVPGRTGCNLLPETAARVADLGNVDSVKEAAGSMDQIQQLLNLGLRVLSGEDGLTFAAMCAAASGTISVVANFAPKLVHDMCAATAAGELAHARELHRKVWDLTQAAFCETNPIPAKTALAEMGKIREEYRLPLVPISDAGRATVKAALKRHGIL